MAAPIKILPIPERHHPSPFRAATLVLSAVILVMVTVGITVVVMNSRSVEQHTTTPLVVSPGNTETTLSILPAVEPIEGILNDIVFSEQGYYGFHASYLLEHDQEQNFSRSSACRVLSPSLDKTLKSISYARLPDEDRAMLITYTAPLVYDGTRFLDVLQNVSDREGGLIEICLTNALYVIANNGVLYRWNQASASEGFTGELKRITKIDDYNSIYGYGFDPDGINGLPLVRTRYADAGYFHWSYFALDTSVDRLMLIESCTSSFIPEVNATPVPGDQTICRREYIPSSP